MEIHAWMDTCCGTRQWVAKVGEAWQGSWRICFTGLSLLFSNLTLFFQQIRMWSCKDCGTTVSTRVHLLKHYRLSHGNFGRKHPYPCTYSDCPCVFKTWNALHSHLSSALLSFTLIFSLFQSKSRMSTPAKLRIVLGEDNCVKLTLPSGIPPEEDSVDSLKFEIQKQCGIEVEILTSLWTWLQQQISKTKEQ